MDFKVDGLLAMVREIQDFVKPATNGALADDGQVRVDVDFAGRQSEEVLDSIIGCVVDREQDGPPAVDGQHPT
jgi:hypothetical protein